MKTTVQLKLLEKIENLKLEFWKLFENWNFENYLRIKVLKIEVENWNFGKLFEKGSFENWNFEKLYENEIS